VLLSALLSGGCCRAQFVLVMLVIFTLTLPFLVLAYVSNIPLAVVLTGE